MAALSASVASAGPRPAYLFLDATFFRMHSGSPPEPVLAAWGITTVLALSRILK